MLFSASEIQAAPGSCEENQVGPRPWVVHKRWGSLIRHENDSQVGWVCETILCVWGTHYSRCDTESSSSASRRKLFEFFLFRAGWPEVNYNDPSLLNQPGLEPPTTMNMLALKSVNYVEWSSDKLSVAPDKGLTRIFNK